MYSLVEVLNVWQTHFDKISTPKYAQEYDDDHFRHVSRCVQTWFNENLVSHFIEIP